MRSLLIRGALLAALLGLGANLAGSVRAQANEVPEQSPAASRSTSFQAATGPTREDVPGAPLLVAAYGIVLVLLLGYVVRLGRLQAGTAREIERLRAAITRSESARSGTERKDPEG